MIYPRPLHRFHVVGLCVLAALFVAPFALEGAVASLPLPTKGDSYTIDNWKRNLGEVVPAKSTFFSPKPGSGIFLREPAA